MQGFESLYRNILILLKNLRLYNNEFELKKKKDDKFLIKCWLAEKEKNNLNYEYKFLFRLKNITFIFIKDISFLKQIEIYNFEKIIEKTFLYFTFEILYKVWVPGWIEEKILSIESWYSDPLFEKHID